LTLSGKDVVSGRPRRFELNDFQVREAIKGPIETIVNAVHRAMEKTPPELVSDIANNGLLLAGGGALLSGLDTLISRDLQVTVHVDQDPLTTVVRGVGRTIKERERFGSAYIN
jgi:rod shape-determining protein MreB